MMKCGEWTEHAAHPHEHIELTIWLHKEHGATGASHDQMSDVAAYCYRNHLSIVRRHEPSRRLVVAGPARQIEHLFGTKVVHRVNGRFGYRTSTVPPQAPNGIQDFISGIFGIDNRPVAKPHFRRLGPSSPPMRDKFSPVEVAKLYNFPPTNIGRQPKISMIELGGGFRMGDLTKYWHVVGLNKGPKVLAVSVDHAHNIPTGDPGGPDGEVALDIEVAGAVAPMAEISVFFAPNTSRGFMDAISDAIHDSTGAPDAISISWGGPEAGWMRSELDEFNRILSEAASLGVTITAASGDNGSDDGVGDSKHHVDFPASSPWVLGCGGTKLISDGEKVYGEVVWGDLAAGGATGGGFSSVWPLPAWQNINAGSRGVPDVSGNADPATGYTVIVDGEETVVGGTSAVAPLWAGLIALMNSNLGRRIGFANPDIYKHRSAFNDITSGSNGAWSGGQGWDACTGLGSPNGMKLLEALRGL
jgi:kumamolisin